MMQVLGLPLTIFLMVAGGVLYLVGVELIQDMQTQKILKVSGVVASIVGLAGYLGLVAL